MNTSLSRLKHREKRYMLPLSGLTRIESKHSAITGVALIRLKAPLGLSLFGKMGDCAMPIMSAQGRNDARTSAWLLASAARDCLNDPASAPSHVIVLNNVYRLLEAYRANSFFGLEPADENYRGAEMPSLIPPLQQHVSTVSDVLMKASDIAFTGESKDQAVSQIANVLKRIAYPEFGPPLETEKTKATRFFSEVAQQLQFA
jgi:hypothetical protein